MRTGITRKAKEMSWLRAALKTQLDKAVPLDSTCFITLQEYCAENSKNTQITPAIIKSYQKSQQYYSGRQKQIGDIQLYVLIPSNTIKCLHIISLCENEIDEYEDKYELCKNGKSIMPIIQIKHCPNSF
jgi:hypothetical protein